MRPGPSPQAVVRPEPPSKVQVQRALETEPPPGLVGGGRGQPCPSQGPARLGRTGLWPAFPLPGVDVRVACSRNGPVCASGVLFPDAPGVSRNTRFICLLSF